MKSYSLLRALALTAALAVLPHVAKASTSDVDVHSSSVSRVAAANVPDAASTVTMLGGGIAALLAFKRRSSARFVL